jgi:PAS domain S-box-containing protein
MLLIASAMVVAIDLLSLQSSESRRVAADQLVISRQIDSATENLLLLLTDAETAERGYVLVGKDAYLDSYNRAVSAIPAAISQLDVDAGKRPLQHQRAGVLKPVVARKLQDLEQIVEARGSGGESAALKIVDSGKGKVLMDDIRARGNEIRRLAEERSAEFSRIAEHSATRLGLVSVIGSMVLLGFLGISAVTIMNGLAQRERLYYEAAANAEFLRITLTSIGDAVIATNSDGRITLINPMATKLTGWIENDAVGGRISEVFRIVNETSGEQVENPVEKAIADGTISMLANHTVLITKNGQEIPIDDSGAPIRAPKGNICGGVLVFRDISARRQAEQQLKESNEHLKDFVSAAAHDLQSPLRSVHAIAQLMSARLRPQLGAEGNEQLGYIMSGTQRMMQLLDDLLAYAHAVHFEWSRTTQTSMDAALRTALDNLRGDIESNSAQVIADALPEVWVHQTHLVQLFQNVIGNALKYRSEQAPRVRITCRRDNAEWVVRVTDNGIGIDPQYADQIFQPFKRLHGADRPGSGIGLATCQKIVSGYGGRIWVESALGQGSTFIFTLPADGARGKTATRA